MSTRSSIFYGEGLHVFEEVNSNDICISLFTAYLQEDEFRQIKLNGAYEDLVISKDSLRQLADNIYKYLEK
jgi:hypothetical protein